MSLSSSHHVVVVGGTSGIGLAVAQAAAGRARVTVGSRSHASVERALAALPSGAGGLAVDVASSSSLEAFFSEIGPFDHLVYTAGDELANTVIADYDPELARAFFDVRLFRALDAVRAALPTLGATGSITLTSGAGAFHGGAGRLLGATLSQAVIKAAQSLAVEIAPIRVNVVAPGITRTPLWAELSEDARSALFEEAGRDTLLGRVAEAEDVVRVYVGFMDSDYVTGNVAVVDGGGSLPA